VAKVKKLTEHFGFVAQDFQTETRLRSSNIHSTRGDGSDCAAILLDSKTQRLKNECKIACIGKGQRERPAQTTHHMRANMEIEWVVLLLEHRVDAYERIGLTTVRPDAFEWTLEWKDIV
jgi:hypothetical protein